MNPKNYSDDKLEREAHWCNSDVNVMRLTSHFLFEHKATPQEGIYIKYCKPDQELVIEVYNPYW